MTEKTSMQRFVFVTTLADRYFIHKDNIGTMNSLTTSGTHQILITVKFTRSSTRMAPDTFTTLRTNFRQIMSTVLEIPSEH